MSTMRHSNGSTQSTYPMHIEEMEHLNIETLKFPVQESCGEEGEKDLRPPQIKEKKIPQENGSHGGESSFGSQHTETNYFLPPYGTQYTEGREQFEGVQSGSNLENFKRKNKWFVIRDRKRQFWEVKLPEFPAQPFKKRRIENGDLRQFVAKGQKRKLSEVELLGLPQQPLKKQKIGNLRTSNKQTLARARKRQFWEVKLPECPPHPFKRRRIQRARKKIEFRGCKRKFRDIKDRKGPSQPLKMKKIGNEGKRLVEKSENRCRTHWGHENNRPCSNSFDPGGSRQANSQVGVIHLVFALQILHL